MEGLGAIDELGPVKLCELQRHTETYHVAVLCMQETHVPGAVKIGTPEGYHVILSGGTDEAREHAGVGFIVAPWAWRHMISYKKISNRMAVLELKVRGGSATLVSAYAPPNTDAHPYDERQKFYSDLGDLLGQGAGHGPKFVFGDMNARVLRQLAHEQEIVGPGAFGSDRAEIHELSNRHLLIELCHRRAMSLASTMRAGRPEELATYRDLGTKPTDEVFIPLTRNWIMR